MGEALWMSKKERDRLVELKLVANEKQTLKTAAGRLRLSYRQAKRAWRRYQEQGAAGLVHQSRGRPSNRSKPAAVRRQSLELYEERLGGFGPTLASEKLLSMWQVEVCAETLRRWLIEEGLWKVRKRRPQHRQWRPRKEHLGEMVQFDGSHHDWFGGGEKSCLMVMIDDATGLRLARLSEQETTAAAMELLWLWIERYGRPQSLYVDGKNVYVTDREPTLEEELAGSEPATVFGRACQRLGIEIIRAWSPEAKGRIERCNRVYQDRLVKEICLQEIQTVAQVNELLDDFDAELNRRFSVPAAQPEDFHRPVARGLDLADVFVFEELRSVQHDWTVRFENEWYQIAKSQRVRPKAKVQVRRRLDGSVQILDRERALEVQKLPERPPRRVPVKTSPKPKPKPRRPADDHPWRRPFLTPKNPPRLEAL
jgi:transposase